MLEVRTAPAGPLLLVVLAVLSAGIAAQAPFPGQLPGTSLGAQLPGNYEASGAAWHPVLQRLVTVSDHGVVSLVDPDGQATVHWTVSGDLEGVCVAHPETDFVYVGVEYPGAIVEFDLYSGTVRRSFDISSQLNGTASAGLEALTFVPDSGNPEGGLFYVGHQGEGTIHVFELPILTSTSSTAVTHVTVLSPGSNLWDLAGLDFNRDTGLLYAVFDYHDRLRELLPDGTLLRQWQLPGSNQEGVALRGCQLFVTEDIGPDIRVYQEFPDTSSCHGLQADTNLLDLSDGGSQQFSLNAGSARAGTAFVLVGSLQGTQPGTMFGGFLVPLNSDPYLEFILSSPAASPVSPVVGPLDTVGQGIARFTLPPLVAPPPALIGATVHHAFLAIDPVAYEVVFVSNAVLLTLVN